MMSRMRVIFKLAPVVMAVLMSVSTAWCATLYVDKATGNDSNDGLSDGAALESISKAAEVAAAGDTVLIKAGEYAEAIVPANSGADGNPIVFEAFPGHAPLILGSERIENWTHYSNNVYYTTIPWNVAPASYPQPRQDRIPITNTSGAGVSPYSSMRASLTEVTSPGDWFFDRTTNRLYLHLHDSGKGLDPDDYLIEAAKRRNCFNLGRRSYIELKGLTMGFTYGSDTEEGAVMLYDSHYISLEDNTIYTTSVTATPPASSSRTMITLKYTTIRSTKTAYWAFLHSAPSMERLKTTLWRPRPAEAARRKASSLSRKKRAGRSTTTFTIKPMKAI